MSSSRAANRARSGFALFPTTYCHRALSCATSRVGILVVGHTHRLPTQEVAINFLDTPLVRLAIRSALVFGPTLAGYVLLHPPPVFRPSPGPLQLHQTCGLPLEIQPELARDGERPLRAGDLRLPGVRPRVVRRRLRLLPFPHAARRGLAVAPALGRAGDPYPSRVTGRGLAEGIPAALPRRHCRVGRGSTCRHAGLSRAYWCLAAVGTVLAANFTTEAWWARKISVLVAISMSLWVTLMAFLVSRSPTQESGRGLGSTAHGSV
jgi:hypothetical protein